MSIRLLIADDHEVVRTGLVNLMADSDIDVVAVASDGDEAVRLAREQHPDVAMLDIRMDRMDGFAALERLKRQHPELPVLIMSLYNNPAYVSRAADLGAAGYLPKGLSRDQIVDTIRAVAGGETAWSREDLRRLAGPTGIAESPTEVDAPLTGREQEVLRLVAEGQTNKQIAHELSISPETVKEHVQHVLRKLGVYDRTQAAVWAVRNGLA
jgi:DNA-binding NarL/FixJ family response regulator